MAFRRKRVAVSCILFSTARLCELLTDKVNMDSLQMVGGGQEISSILDNRFPEDAAHDNIGEVLDRVFEIKVRKGENTASFTGRAREIVHQSEAEGVAFPSIAKGCMILRAARLPLERKAVVLAASRRSYEGIAVAAALRTTYPDLLANSAQRVHAVEAGHETEDDQHEVDTLLAGTSRKRPGRPFPRGDGMLGSHESGRRSR